ncbi:MAG TPA: hypothetical protein EYP69_01600, partial [Bacteroidales bacterium]|nr:hypothetical protein [Bacteroidales bacterium]
MKKQDILFIIFSLILFSPFFLSDTVYQFYLSFNKSHGFVMAFIKFAILASLGELIGLRIRTGQYLKPEFGLAARMIYWGIFGLTIKMAFIIFATGVPNFLQALGLNGANELMKGPLVWQKVLLSFSISATMNLIYAPVLMTFHKITDTHLLMNKGSFRSIVKPIEFGKIMQEMDWGVQWHFVFKKTIP